MVSPIFLFDRNGGKIVIEKIDPVLYPDLEAEIRQTVRNYERMR